MRNMFTVTLEKSVKNERKNVRFMTSPWLEMNKRSSTKVHIEFWRTMESFCPEFLQGFLNWLPVIQRQRSGQGKLEEFWHSHYFCQEKLVHQFVNFSLGVQNLIKWNKAMECWGTWKWRPKGNIRHLCDLMTCVIDWSSTQNFRLIFRVRKKCYASGMLL